MPEDWRRRAIRWLGRSNAAQQSWAINYLREKGWFLRGRGPSEPSYDYLVAHIRDAPEALKKEDDLRKMKRAWSQKKKRDEQGPRKSYSFIMSKSIGPKLRQLAKERNEPAYKALEAVILEYRDIVKSKAWIDLSQSKIENLLEKVKQELKDAEDTRKELEAGEAEIQSQLAVLEARAKDLEVQEDKYLEDAVTLDKQRDLILQLYDDYSGMTHAHALGKSIIGRRASLPLAPWNYKGQSKASHFLQHYQDLLASLKR
jgi:hypothetical protein